MERVGVRLGLGADWVLADVRDKKWTKTYMVHEFICKVVVYSRYTKYTPVDGLKVGKTPLGYPVDPLLLYLDP